MLPMVPFIPTLKMNLVCPPSFYNRNIKPHIEYLKSYIQETASEYRLENRVEVNIFK